MILTIHSVCPFLLGNLLRAPGLNSDCAYERGETGQGAQWGDLNVLEDTGLVPGNCPPPLWEKYTFEVPGGHTPFRWE